MPPTVPGYTIYRVPEQGCWQPLFCCANQRQWDAGLIVAQLLRGRTEYRLAGFYVEFENVADPDDVVAVPSFGADEGIEYYQTLAGARDYLRIGLVTTPTLDIVTGYGDYFDRNDPEQGNRLTLFGQTEGFLGVNGVEFSAAANSKVCGVALVAIPNPDDRSQDRIFARGYYPTDRQLLKQASSQIGISWRQPLLFED